MSLHFFQSVIPCFIGEEKIADAACGLNTRELREPRECVTIKPDQLRSRSIAGKTDSHGENFCSRKTGVDVKHCNKTANQKTGSGQEHRGNCELGNDENILQTSVFCVSAALCPANLTQSPASPRKIRQAVAMPNNRPQG